MLKTIQSALSRLGLRYSLFLMLAAMGLCPSAVLLAQTTRTWTGAASSNWFNAANWSPVGVPASNDTVNINNSGSDVFINLDSPVTINGTFNWTGAVVLMGSGLTVAANGVLNMNGPGYDLLCTLTNAGTVNWTSGNLQFYNGGGGTALIQNLAGGNWNIQCDQSLVVANGFQSTYFQNAGTVYKSTTTGTATIQLSFTNTGTVNVQSGTINCTGEFADAGGALEFGIGGVTTYGQIAVSGAAPLGGTLTANLNNGYVPAFNVSFPLMTYNSFSGSFADTNLPAALIWSVNYGSNTLSVVPTSVPVAPSVVTPPQNVTETATYNAAFTVGVAGTAPFSYQWLFDGTNLPAATNATLTISNLSISSVGQYAMIVTNGAGSVTSSPPTILTVLPPLDVFTLAGMAGVPGTNDGTETAARFGFSEGVAVDSAGNAYVADTYNQTIRKVTPSGAVITLAGLAGQIGSTDGTRSAARFNYPTGVAVDSSENIYVADQSNDTIRKVTPMGMVTTLAGLAGSSGTNDGTGSAARFGGPGSLALDSAGNLYVSDYVNNTIRQVTPSGTNWVVTTLAGLAGTSGTNDGTGNAARFNNPEGVAVDSAGNIYVADAFNFTIRKVTPSGTNWVVTTLAGLAGSPGANDGNGSAGRFDLLTGMAIDRLGDLYVADTANDTIRQVSPVGTNWVVTTLAGLAKQNNTTDGTGSAAQFHEPEGVAVDSMGNVYVADSGNNTIRIGYPNYGRPNFSPALPQTVTESATYNTTLTATASGAPPLSYQWFFDTTNALPGDTNASLTLTDLTTNEASIYTLMVSNAEGSLRSPPITLTVTQPLTMTTFAGAPTLSGTADGVGAFARFESPQGVTVDLAGNVYVADAAANTIRKITPGGVVSTLAGQAGIPGFGNGTGGSARFNDPNGVAVDTNGNVYVSDYENGIRMITPGGVVTTLAQNLGGGPLGIAVGAGLNVYVSLNDQTIRQITPNGTVSLVAGQASSPGSADGTNGTARFNQPAGLALDGQGNLYVADSANNTIRMIAFVSGNAIVTTIAGQPGSGLGYKDGVGTAATFYTPYGLAFDNHGNLYVADSENDLIRKMIPVSGQWIVTTVAGALSENEFHDGLGSAAEMGAPPGLASDAAGNIYVADTEDFVIRKGVLGPAILAQPQSQSVQVSNNATFTVTVSGAAPLAYQWFLNGAVVSGATGSALLLTNVHNAQAGNYTVVVTNSGGSTTSAVAALTVTYPNGATVDPGLTAMPVGQSVAVGGSALFSVAASGTGPFAYQWLFNGGIISGATGSSLALTNSTAAAGGNYEVVVSNAAGSVTSAPATLIVSAPLAVVTVAGLAGFRGAIDGPGMYARFENPCAVAADFEGNVYVADAGSNTIEVMTPSGVVSTLAGQAGATGFQNGVGTNALFSDPVGVAVDGEGNVYVADYNNAAVRQIFPGGFVITLASGFNPTGVAVDAFGNVYVCAADHAIRQIAPDGTVVVIAGIPNIPGSADGAGVYARFNLPSSIAVDGQENLYVGDQNNYTIRKIAFTGVNWVTTTLAGLAGIPGSSDGVGSSARFGGYTGYNASLLGVAVDAAGTVYVADQFNDIIREISPNGIVATVAGLAGNNGFADGLGAEASFGGPSGVAVDSAENVYIADANNSTIRRGVIGVTITTPPQSQAVAVGSNAVLNVVAAGAQPLAYQWFFNTAGIPGATNASLAINNAHHPAAGNYTVVVSNPGGSVTSTVAALTVTYPAGAPVDPAFAATPQNQIVTAGNNAYFDVSVSGTPPLSYQWFFDGQSMAAQTNGFLFLTNVLAGAAGSYDVVVSNVGGSITTAPAVLTVTVPLTVTTMAGPAGFVNPAALAVDSNGNVYVCDPGDQTVRKVSASGAVTLVAGSPGMGGSADGTNGAAQFNDPDGIVADGQGNLFVADGNNENIREIMPSGTNWIVTTIAGSTDGESGAADGAGTAARFYGPGQLAADRNGNMFVPDFENNTIRKVSLVGTNWVVSTIAGSPGSVGTVDGIGGGARFNNPASLAVDANSNIYVADAGNSTIRKISPSAGGWLVTTLAGLPNNAGAADGMGSSARFNNPQSVALDRSGKLYVADATPYLVSGGNNTIRQINPSGSNWIVSTIAGLAGYSGSANGLGSVARFFDPAGVTVDGAGNVYVSDSFNNLIRKGGFYPSILGLPQSDFAALGSNAAISAVVTGTLPLSYQWQFNGTNLAGATGAVLNLSAVPYAAAGSYSVIVTNNYGAATSFVAALSVLAPPAILTQPASTAAAAGENAAFGVGAGGDALAYQWQFNGANLPGATNATLAFNAVTGGQVGSYTVVITNSVGAITSAVATLVLEGTAVPAGNVNSTWTVANSPYVIGGNVTVSSLTVQPGVSVLFNGPYSLTVTGLLQAIGASNQPITFSGVSPGTGWQGIRFVSANTNSAMSWCVVSGAAAGGLRFTNTPFTLASCVIASNSGVSGGGIYTDSALLLQNCTLRNNAALYAQKGGNYFVQGGGLYVAGGNVVLQSCSLSNNTAVMPNIGPVLETSTGGAIDCETGQVTLNNCVVVNNTASGAGLSATALGGGAYANNLTASLAATGSVFAGNGAGSGFGGALAVGNSALLACLFSGNNATYGGGWYLSGTAQTMATNCLLFGNSAALGGAVYSTAGAAAGDLENCTLTHNSPDALNGFTGVVHDSILYFDGNEIVPGPVTNPVVLYCDVESSEGGSNIISLDPQFANSTNYTLSETSPAIDAGDPAPQFDDEAFPPSQGGDLNDLGAYGGPGAAFWPAFSTHAPVVLINGQPSAPFQTWQLAVTSTNEISFANGFPGGTFEYTLDGSDPLVYPTFTTSPFLLTNTATIRPVAYSADYSMYSIGAPVTVEVLPSYTLIAGAAGGGGVFPAGGLFFSNTVVTVTATNAPGWTFLHWSGSASGTNNPLQVVVHASNNIQAVFGTPLSTGVIGSGTVQTNPALPLYPYGSTVQLMAIPNNTNIYFRFWGGAAVGDSVSPLDFVLTNASPNVTALFGGLPAGYCTLNLLVNGSGDVLRSPLSNSYAAGSVVTLTPSPTPGYSFTGWSGGAVGSNNPLSVTLNSDVTITANFISTNIAPQPPSIAITSPAPGAQFVLPATITINASATDPNTNANGTISQVAFFSGTNLLGIATNSPFVFAWTNAPVGAASLSAVAVDNLGLSGNSSAVNITVALPPPGPAVFSVASGVYSVLENGGSVTVTVNKSLNSLAGTVNYATANGSALAVTSGQSVGNYQAAAGSLSFAAGQTSQTVSIPIVDNTVYEGNTMFSFSLASSGDGSSVGAPGSASVTIVDVNQPSTTNSVLANIFPTPVPESDGSLEVVPSPANAQGQWRLTWETVWHNSGYIISGLPTGNYPVVFSPVAGFLEPGETTYPVTAGALALETNQYAASGTTSYGSLTVTLYPSPLAGAAWQLQGDTNWYPGGFVTNNLVSGEHIVQFQAVAGRITPAPQAVFVGPNEESVASAVYLVTEQSSATAPSLVQFSDATTPEFGWPFVYAGQLLTEVGYGSGCVVQPRVVLTAGHMVFNDVTLSYSENVSWFFQEYSGMYDPPAQIPAGWYINSGYAAARTNDLANGGANGVESPASQNEDIAALYFLSNAGRGGSSGYLVSGSNTTEWLQSTAPKTLVGYPVESVSPIDVMYYTGFANLNFTQVTNSVFSTTGIIGYGGMSGGPLCVEYTNGIYYPAAVYLGGTSSTTVRVIDGDVASLINSANVTANTGANHSGGGVISVVPGAGIASNPGILEVTIAPPGAVADGGAWKLSTLSDAYYSTANPSALAITSTNGVQLDFKAITGWNAPTNQPVPVGAGAEVNLTCSYTLAISWPTPSAILYGTALNSNQLDAVVSAASGAFTYSPTNGTVLSPGTHTLSVTFTPSNTVSNGGPVSTNVSLVVLPSAPVIQTAKRSGSSFSFTWTAVSNQTYQIQFATNLTQTNWTALPGSIIATNTAATVSETISNNARQFYRVVLLP